MAIVADGVELGDIATAIQAADLLPASRFPLASYEAEAKLMIVKALVKVGAVADAEALLDGMAKPVAGVEARLVLAQAFHDAGLIADAERQFEFVFAAILMEAAPNRWSIRLLIESADLAHLLDMPAIARKHALAVFSTIDRLQFPSDDAPHDGDLARLERVLKEVGATGKASAVRAKISGDAPFDVLRHPYTLDDMIARLRTELKHKDDGAEATFGTIRALVLGNPQRVFPRHLQATTELLLEYRSVDEAMAFADLIVTQSGQGIDASPAYQAIVRHDPSLAADLLAAPLNTRIKTAVSLALASELVDAAREEETRQVLQDAAARLATCDGDALVSFDPEDGDLAEVILAQEKLGFASDAALARKTCLSLLLSGAPGPSRLDLDLMALASSFP